MRLRRGQVSEHASRQIRVDPHAFQRRDNAIAAERRAEPRNARIGIGTGRGVGNHHVQIGNGPVDPVVEMLLRTLDHADVRLSAHESAIGRGQRLVERQQRGVSIDFAGDGHVNIFLLSGLER